MLVDSPSNNDSSGMASKRMTRNDKENTRRSIAHNRRDTNVVELLWIKLGKNWRGHPWKKTGVGTSADIL